MMISPFRGRVHGIRHARSVDLSTELVRKRSRLTHPASIRVRQTPFSGGAGSPAGIPRTERSIPRPPPRVGTTVSSGSPRTRASWSPGRPPATCTAPSRSRATRSAGSGTTANSTWSRAGPRPRAASPPLGVVGEQQPVGAALAQLERPGAALRRLGRFELGPRRTGERAGCDDPELRRGQPRIEVRLGCGKDETDEIGARRVGQRVGDQRSPHGGGAPALDVIEDRRSAERGPVLEANPGTQPQAPYGAVARRQRRDHQPGNPASVLERPGELGDQRLVDLPRDELLGPGLRVQRIEAGRALGERPDQHAATPGHAAGVDRGAVLCPTAASGDRKHGRGGCCELRERTKAGQILSSTSVLTTNRIEKKIVQRSRFRSTSEPPPKELPV